MGELSTLNKENISKIKIKGEFQNNYQKCNAYNHYSRLFIRFKCCDLFLAKMQNHPI